ncbi:MAG: hypothetical protein ABSG04_08030 [Verrucomicrobiota bacterium]
MRTKTLLLSGVVAALSSACVMAQVYSLNAVGYINVTCPPGFSIMANQLNTTNNNLSPLLDSQLLDSSKDGTTFYKYNKGNYAILTVDSFSTVLPFIPWDQTFATSTTLNPGEAIFVHNGFTTNLTFTFVGTVLQGALTNSTMTNGFTLLSSMVPQAGRLDVDLGMPEVDGDVVYIFNPSTSTSPGYQIYSGDEFNTFSSAPWDAPAGQPINPTVGVGQGFWYHAGVAYGQTINYNGSTTPGTASSYPSLWVRTFNVN